MFLTVDLWLLYLKVRLAAYKILGSLFLFLSTLMLLSCLLAQSDGVEKSDATLICFPL